MFNSVIHRRPQSYHYHARDGQFCSIASCHLTIAETWLTPVQLASQLRYLPCSPTKRSAFIVHSVASNFPGYFQFPDRAEKYLNWRSPFFQLLSYRWDIYLACVSTQGMLLWKSASKLDWSSLSVLFPVEQTYTQTLILSPSQTPNMRTSLNCLELLVLSLALAITAAPIAENSLTAREADNINLSDGYKVSKRLDPIPIPPL